MKRQTTKNPNVRRMSRQVRLNTAAAGVRPALPGLGGLWSVSRSKIVAMVLILCLVGALAAFFNLDLFYVYDFQVAGLRYLTREEVERASGVVGYNVFFIESRAVERALTKLPEVKSAQVTVQLPNQVVVHIVERQPKVIWQRGAETYWVDAEGIALRARANPPNTPVIRDLDQSAVKPGGRVTVAALDAFHALRDAWLDAPRQVEWSAARGLAFTDEHGWKIYLGSADDMAGKLARLRALAPQLVAQNARIRFIDLGKGDPYFQ